MIKRELLKLSVNIIYTETEFLHPPKMDDLYIEHYNDKFVIEENYAILEIINISKE